MLIPLLVKLLGKDGETITGVYAAIVFGSIKTE